MRLLLILLLFGIGFNSCVEAPNQFTHLPPGKWRGVLKLSDPDVLNTSFAGSDQDKLTDYFELPFNFEVSYTDGEMEIALLNGEESIPVETVHYGRDPKTAMDTLQMLFTSFDTKLDGYYEENIIEGYWKVNYKKGYSIPFYAEYGKEHRFVSHSSAEPVDYSGLWQVEFEYDLASAYSAVGDFQQEGIDLTGTFLTETGDYRFLQGNVIGDKLKLSVFDGAHAFLFSGSMSGDTIFGEFRSGKHYKSKWRAVRTDSVNLTDPYEMSESQLGTIGEFVFEDTNGAMYDLNSKSNENKIKLLNVMGTWCPNCKDEMNYLKEIARAYPAESLEIITLGFEKYKDKSKAVNQLRRYKEAMDVDWPVLYGGYANRDSISKQLDFLEKFYSYPTLFMLDKSNNIVHIHTGFNGPATSQYESFDKDFRNKLDQLIQE